MNRRAYLKSSLALGCGLLLPTGVLGLVGCSNRVQAPGLTSIGGSIMGTGYSVLVDIGSDTASQLSQTEHSQLAEKIHRVLQDVDARMSTWRNDSEVSLFNRSLSQDWHPISPATADVVTQALSTSELSDGAFDISVSPVVNLWGFGPNALSSEARSNYKKPSAQSISDALQVMGFDAIQIDGPNNAIRKTKPGLQIDLSGIAKGYAVDRVASALLDAGFNRFLVEVGGELRSYGKKRDGSNWRVAIESPQLGERGAYRILRLDGQAIATSGDYRNFYIAGGERYSHSIDPRTGQPVAHEMASVTVVAKTTMQADAWSTAMMVMGPQDAFDFAKRHALAAHFILKTDAGLKEMYSPELAPLMV